MTLREQATKKFNKANSAPLRPNPHGKDPNRHIQSTPPWAHGGGGGQQVPYRMRKPRLIGLVQSVAPRSGFVSIPGHAKQIVFDPKELPYQLSVGDAVEFDIVERNLTGTTAERVARLPLVKPVTEEKLESGGIRRVRRMLRGKRLGVEEDRVTEVMVAPC